MVWVVSSNSCDVFEETESDGMSWLAVTVLRCPLPAAGKQVKHQTRKQICCHSQVLLSYTQPKTVHWKQLTLLHGWLGQHVIISACWEYANNQCTPPQGNLARFPRKRQVLPQSDFSHYAKVDWKQLFHSFWEGVWIASCKWWGDLGPIRRHSDWDNWYIRGWNDGLLFLTCPFLQLVIAPQQ